MERRSGPHPVPGGFFHLLYSQGKAYGIELRLKNFAGILTFLTDEGFTVIALTPCCGSSLSAYPRTRGEDGRPLHLQEWPPYRCGYCGSEALLPGVIDTWWQVGSTETLAKRLEYYFETWGQENVLATEIRAHEMAAYLLAFEPDLAVLRGFASAWPRPADG